MSISELVSYKNHKKQSSIDISAVLLTGNDNWGKQGKKYQHRSKMKYSSINNDSNYNDENQISNEINTKYCQVKNNKYKILSSNYN